MPVSIHEVPPTTDTAPYGRENTAFFFFFFLVNEENRCNGVPDTALFVFDID